MTMHNGAFWPFLIVNTLVTVFLKVSWLKNVEEKYKWSHL